MDADGKRIAAHTIFQASGAADYSKRLEANPDALRKALLNKKTYDRMREILDEVLIPVNLKEDARQE